MINIIQRVSFGGLSISIFLVSCQSSTSESWAYEFVRYDGESYVVSDALVIEKEKVGEKIGSVTKYITKEGDYSGNVSNTYQEGTTYYKITGVGTDNAIAVKQKNGTYIKAVISEVWNEEE